MRIIQLISQTVLGGAESYGYSLASELSRRGHQVRLLANRENGPLFERSRPGELEVVALRRSSRLDPKSLTFLHNQIREFEPDVLHGHNFGANTWARAIGVLHPRLSIVCHVHSGRMVTSHPPRRVRLDRILYKRADAVIGLNQEQVEYIHRSLGVPREKIHFMPNGIDMDTFHVPEEAARNRNEVVCVASLTPVKNHAALLDAWRQVRAELPDARLTLVGDGELRQTLESQCGGLGLLDSVRFAGLQSDVAPYLARAGVFVLPSLREALPLSMLEAMAAGMAVVGTNVGGIPEVIDDEVNGLVIPAGDVDALARALLRVLQDHPYQHQLGVAARESVVEKYSLAAAVDRLEELYSACRAAPL